MHNIIVFGEAGAGKSSIVNMILGQNVAKVSASIESCTLRNDAFPVTIGNITFNIYDTVGLNEGDQGRVPHWTALRELYTLIRQLEGVSLLIYCMRGRVKENERANWLLFNKVICGEKIPIIAAVTGLETYDDPDDWWKDKTRRDLFRKNGITPKAIGCVVSFPGRRNEYAHKYAKSQTRLQDLIVRNYLHRPWSEEKDKWFANMYAETFSTVLRFTTESRLDYTKKMRGMIQDFIKETGMKEEDSEKINAALLNAEKELRKGPTVVASDSPYVFNST